MRRRNAHYYYSPMSFLTKLFRSQKIQNSLDPLTEKALSKIAVEVAALRNLLEQSVINFEASIALGEQRSESSSRNQQFESEQKLTAHFENRLLSLNEALVSHIENTVNSTTQATATATATALLTQELTKIRREIDSLRALFSTSTNDTSPSHERQTPNVDPTIYAAIEEHFRGSQEVIANRQMSYLPYLQTAKQQQLPILDLGCGRGEWLEILKSEGLICEGIDTNAVFIAECNKKGLDTTNIDLLSYLSSQSSPRFGAITLFQVAEHLPFNVLIEVFRAARKCLVPGGVFIVETPNAKNLRVGAGTFWIDPTHERPLYPELLEFLSQLVGFEKYETKYSASNVDLYKFSDAPPHTRAVLESLTLAVDGPADYALIATA